MTFFFFKGRKAFQQKLSVIFPNEKAVYQILAETSIEFHSNRKKNAAKCSVVTLKRDSGVKWVFPPEH